MIHQILTMLDLQEEMNQKVHPDWRSQKFEWYRAIWVECAELMDHYGWKWWKKQSPDRDQVVLEIIDIWHFGLSQLLQTDDKQKIAQSLQQQLMAPAEPGSFLEDVELFAGNTLNNKTFDACGFVRLMAGMDLSFDELYRRYVGKNVLNLFRQDHGYQNGSYHKVWSGEEDNEHLIQVLDLLDVSQKSFRDDVYTALKQRYPS